VSLRDYLKSHRTWAKGFYDSSVASVTFGCDILDSAQSPQNSVSPATVTTVATVEVNYANKQTFHSSEANDSEAHTQKINDFFSENEFKYIKSNSKEGKITHSEKNIQDTLTVATAVTLEDFCTIQGGISSDISATVATVDSQSSQKVITEKPILWLEQQIEMVWQSSTPTIIKLDKCFGIDAKIIEWRTRERLEMYWLARPWECSLMSAKLVKGQPSQLLIFRIPQDEYLLSKL